MILLSIAEFRTFDNDTRIALQSLVADFCTDMLTFSIAIRPDEENSRIPSLLGDVVCDGFLVLSKSAVYQIIDVKFSHCRS